LISFIITLLIFVAFAPLPSTVYAATTDTIDITFDPEGNVSIEVSPTSYAFGTVWAGDSKPTSTHSYFTIWNNGTIDNMFTDIRISNGAADLSLDDDSVPSSDNYYSIRVLQGSVSENPWLATTNRDLDGDLDRSGSDNFGLRVYIAEITQDWNSQSVEITLTAAQS
jgi:hypothetical protein